MTLLDILNEKVIKVELEAKDKEGALKELVGILDESDLIQDKEKTLEAVKKREELMSTGIGHGVAIPHAKVEGVDKVIAALGKSKEGIDFKALDGEPVYIFFLLIAPEEDTSGYHIRALARISRFLKHGHFRERLKKTKTAKEILELIREEEEEHS